MADIPDDPLGPVAHALADSRSDGIGDATDEAVADAVVELAQLHAADYLRRDGDEMDRALTRVVMRQVPGVDRTLVNWLAARPSAERVGVASRALWHLWSTAVPHPPIDRDVVLAFVGAARSVPLGLTEIGPYRAALSLASRQVTDPATSAILDQAEAETRG
jgi:hypothetical protein